MKKTLLTILFIIGTVSIFAQTQTKEQELSNAEKFSAKSGTLIQKEFFSIGKIKDAEIEVVHYVDLVSSQKQSAVKFSYEHIGKYNSDTKTAILDSDEIDGLMKSIKIIQEKIFPTTATNYIEVSFKSRGGFEAGCFWSKNTWSTYLKLEKYDSDSYVFLEKDDFTTLLTLLEKAKAKL
ncbi:MAG: hypothetical protein ACO1PI_15605 [Bacteroidota bacterium]